MILPPAPTPSETDTRNENSPQNGKKRGKNYQNLVDNQKVPGRKESLEGG